MGGTVLVVDDHSAIRNLLTDFLTRERYKVIAASSGEEAIDLAKREAPQVIVLDMNMPGLDGLETCRRLKADEKTSPIPVIMMTGEAPVEEEMMEAGADGSISKPFTLIELSALLKSVLGTGDGADSRPSQTRRASPDRRSHERFEVQHPVTVKTPKGEIRGVTGNLSSGGAFIRCQELLDLKERFFLAIEFPSLSVGEASAEVVWSEAAGPDDDMRSCGMGVRFLW